jgi:hypothetical protein
VVAGRARVGASGEEFPDPLRRALDRLVDRFALLRPHLLAQLLTADEQAGNAGGGHAGGRDEVVLAVVFGDPVRLAQEAAILELPLAHPVERLAPDARRNPHTGVRRLTQPQQRDLHHRGVAAARTGAAVVVVVVIPRALVLALHERRGAILDHGAVGRLSRRRERHDLHAPDVLLVGARLVRPVHGGRRGRPHRLERAQHRFVLGGNARFEQRQHRQRGHAALRHHPHDGLPGPVATLRLAQIFHAPLHRHGDLFLEQLALLLALGALLQAHDHLGGGAAQLLVFARHRLLQEVVADGLLAHRDQDAGRQRRQLGVVARHPRPHHGDQIADLEPREGGGGQDALRLAAGAERFGAGRGAVGRSQPRQAGRHLQPQIERHLGGGAVPQNGLRLRTQGGVAVMDGGDTGRDAIAPAALGEPGANAGGGRGAADAGRGAQRGRQPLAAGAQQDGDVRRQGRLERFAPGGEFHVAAQSVGLDGVRRAEREPWEEVDEEFPRLALAPAGGVELHQLRYGARLRGGAGDPGVGQRDRGRPALAPQQLAGELPLRRVGIAQLLHELRQLLGRRLLGVGRLGRRRLLGAHRGHRGPQPQGAGLVDSHGLSGGLWAQL